MTNVWLGVPFMMVALLGGLQAIDADLLDAASVDGASAFRRFWDVTLPGLRPVAATVILLGLIWTFNMFNIIFLITGGGPANATQIFPTFAYRAAFTDYLYGQAAAWGVIILSMLLVFGTAYRWLVARTRRGDVVVSAHDESRPGPISGALVRGVGLAGAQAQAGTEAEVVHVAAPAREPDLRLRDRGLPASSGS